MKIDPSGSVRRNRAAIIELLPAPVLNNWNIFAIRISLFIKRYRLDVGTDEPADNANLFLGMNVEIEIF